MGLLFHDAGLGAELAAEFRERNRSADEIDRDTIFEAKLQVLRELFNYQPSPEREEAFVRYAREEGRGLRELRRTRAVGQIARHHHQIGAGAVHPVQQRFDQRRAVEAEMQVRKMHQPRQDRKSVV